MCIMYTLCSVHYVLCNIIFIATGLYCEITAGLLLVDFNGCVLAMLPSIGFTVALATMCQSIGSGADLHCGVWEAKGPGYDSAQYTVHTTRTVIH